MGWLQVAGHRVNQNLDLESQQYLRSLWSSVNTRLPVYLSTRSPHKIPAGCYPSQDMKKVFVSSAVAWGLHESAVPTGCCRRSHPLCDDQHESYPWLQTTVCLKA